MAAKNLLLIETLCLHYKITPIFFNELKEIGLIQIKTIKQKQFIDQDIIGALEKMIRLHHELNVNIEGIDVVFNMLRKEIKLQEEIVALKNRLQLYEND